MIEGLAHGGNHRLHKGIIDVRRAAVRGVLRIGEIIDRRTVEDDIVRA